MKFKGLSFFVILFLHLMGHSKLIGQIDEVVDRFVLVEKEGKVFMSITIAAGFSCNGIGILRSTNGIDFLEVGMIQGICGSPTSPSFYEFIDENPVKNKFNYYKLILGNIGENTPKTILVVDDKGGKFSILSNPISDKLQILKKEENEPCLLILYDGMSRIVYQDKFDSEYYETQLRNLNGIYYLSILQNNEYVFSRILFFE
ncbi:MAG: hypothetical protein RLZZ546_196 [Bacteroidota bacterium]|jgi:hypothetical protein